jgi:hypothetical protein
MKKTFHSFSSQFLIHHLKKNWGYLIIKYKVKDVLYMYFPEH